METQNLQCGWQEDRPLAASLTPSFSAGSTTVKGAPWQRSSDIASRVSGDVPPPQFGRSHTRAAGSILGSIVGSIAGRSVVSPDIDLAAGRQAGRRIRRSRARKDRLVYGWTVSVILALTFAMEAAKLWGPLAACRQVEEWVADREYCNALYTYFIWLPTITKQSLGVGMALYGFIAFLVRISWVRRVMTNSQQGTDGEGTAQLSADDLRSMAGHWTVAASHDSYHETSRLLVGVLLMSTLIGGMATMMMTTVQILNAVANYSNEDTFSETIRACCDGSAAEWDSAVCSSHCLWGYTGFATLLTVTMGLFGVLSASLVFIPPKLWSPITLQAVRKTNDTQMRRLLRLPAFTTVFLVANLCGFVLFAGQLLRLDFQWNSVLWAVSLYAMVLFVMAQIVVVLWVMPWAHLRWKVGSIIRRMQVLAASLGGGTAVHPLQEDSAPQWQRKLPGRTLECASYRLLVILYCSMYIFGVEGGTWGVTESIVYPIWTMRAIALLMIMLTRDEPVGFEELHVSGAAFGLAINARQLRTAVKAHLEGKPHRSKVHRYKASLLRMADTMAVSYRWSSQVVEVGDGLMLNMTEWQLRQLVVGIERSKCQFVWLDSCSVPQDVSNSLKSTLLSRMMAVYASSFVTLVLITREKETERYHQRMWTLQEFCTSSQLMVATEEEEMQPRDDSEIGAEPKSSTCLGMEGIHAEAQRAKHLAAQATIMPVWLGDNIESVVRSIPKPEAVRLWKTFSVLSSKRHCLYRADRVRALYPLVWNRPSESEEELQAFIQAVEAVHGISQQEILDHLRAYNNHSTARGARFLSNPGVHET